MTSADPAAAAATPPQAISLSLDEALQFAIERHKLDELDVAEPIYRALLERWPGRADVLNFMGILQQQRGRSEVALALLRRAAAAAPKQPGVWNNLGNVLLQMDRAAEAEKAFRRSVALADSAEARTNIARLLRRRNEWAGSEAACRRALALAPQSGEAWHHLSLALLGQGRSPEAFEAAVQAELLLPPHARRRESYARALMAAGEVDRAVAVYREWLAEEPDNPYVRHHLAACSGEGTPERASDAYVEQMFDKFAATFDTRLASLHYRAPELVTGALRAVLPAPARQFDIADLGCGTGLCGPLLRGWARRLAGCDLSAAMLAQAARRDAYDELLKAELVQYLEERPQSFDVVVSADTLIYFGDLAPVFRAARAALRADGEFVFTLEALPADDDADYRLRESGRYAHGLPYLRARLAAAGLSLRDAVGEPMREEGGRPVPGWLVTARRAG